MRKRPLPSFDEDLPDEALVNLTPLIDVVFVVLITFMLIAPVLDIDSITLAPSGPASATQASQNSPLSISIRADDSIWLKGKCLSLGELEKMVTLEKKLFPKETPQLIPDSRSHFETYQQVKNVLESCGFEQMDIILRPQ